QSGDPTVRQPDVTAFCVFATVVSLPSTLQERSNRTSPPSFLRGASTQRVRSRDTTATCYLRLYTASCALPTAHSPPSTLRRLLTELYLKASTRRGRLRDRTSMRTPWPTASCALPTAPLSRSTFPAQARACSRARIRAG